TWRGNRAKSSFASSSASSGVTGPSSAGAATCNVLCDFSANTAILVPYSDCRGVASAPFPPLNPRQNYSCRRPNGSRRRQNANLLYAAKLTHACCAVQSRGCPVEHRYLFYGVGASALPGNSDV